MTYLTGEEVMIGDHVECMNNCLYRGDLFVKELSGSKFFSAYDGYYNNDRDPNYNKIRFNNPLPGLVYIEDVRLISRIDGAKVERKFVGLTNTEDFLI